MLQSRSPKRSPPRRNSTRTAKKKVTYNELKTEDNENEMETEEIVDNELSFDNDDDDWGDFFALLI